MIVYPTNVKFNVETGTTTITSADGEKQVNMIAFLQDGTNYQVVFNQDESTVDNKSFTELGIALTKYGYMVGDAEALTGTINIVAYVNGMRYHGEVADNSVTLSMLS